MHTLERLAADLHSNPNVIKDIEKEVEALAYEESCSALIEIRASKVPAVHIFLCNILQKRIQRKATTLDLAEEVQFCTQMLAERPSFQTCEVYSLLGLYCWPVAMPDFIDVICMLLGANTGYQILLLFLEKVNTSTRIDEKRRSELKKAISIVYPRVESGFREEFAAHIIPIFTELLKILPKNFDFTLVYKKAAECPEEVISFIIEGIQFMNPSGISSILQFLPADQNLIMSLLHLKPHRTEKSMEIFNYVFRALRSDSECFIAAVDFWQRIFSSMPNEALLDPVLTEILKNYIETDEEIKEDADPHVFGFLAIVCKNFPVAATNFLNINGNALPVRISAYFIQKLAKNADTLSLLSTVKFESPYLSCLTFYFRNDPNAPKLLFSLNFTDKESVKLAVLILEKYNFTQEELMHIIDMCKGGCLNSNEIKVDCCVKLGVHETFGANWTMDDVIKYFYYLKRSPEEYRVYKDYFYSLFVQNAPFDRCFSVIEKLGPVPTLILQNIYEKMDKYPYIDLTCFNNDLLPYLDNPLHYIEKEVLRFVTDWNSITDHKDYYQAIRSLLGLISAKIDTLPIADHLVDLVQIDSSIILSRVLSILGSYKGTYNTNKAVYYLICAYNSPSVADLHTLISGVLTDCMMRTDGGTAFHSILGIDINKCCEVREQILKLNRKTAQGMVRDLIKEFKGKSFNRMFEDEFKVTKQNILPPKVKEEVEYDLKDVNFT